MAKDLKGEVRDQAAHMIAAGFVLAPVFLWPSVFAVAWAGFWVGVVREVTELGNPVSLEKVWKAIAASKLDLTFWTLGAVGWYLAVKEL